MQRSVGTTVGPGTNTVADATSNFDALDKLKDFLTGVTAGNPVALPVIERWTVLKDDVITAPTPSVSGNRELYLRGPGLSGTDAIFVNIKALDSISSNVFQWKISMATGFDGGQTFDNQPGATPFASWLTLDRFPAGMPFWFIASGRRFICIFKVVTTYVACYAGWYLPYATPTEFPYPGYLGGNTSEFGNRVDTTNYEMGNFYDAPVKDFNEATGSLRHRDGTWKSVGSYNSSTGAIRPSSVTQVNAFIQPFDWRRSAITPEYFLINNADGSYPVFPTVLYTEQSGGNVYGELDGVCYTPSRGNSTESTITIGSDVYLVIDNVYRATEAYVAILLK